MSQIPGALTKPASRSCALGTGQKSTRGFLSGEAEGGGWNLGREGVGVCKSVVRGAASSSCEIHSQLHPSTHSLVCQASLSLCWHRAAPQGYKDEFNTVLDPWLLTV